MSFKPRYILAEEAEERIVILLVCLVFVVLWLYALITYGGKPITEIPSWAIPFILGNRG